MPSRITDSQLPSESHVHYMLQVGLHLILVGIKTQEQAGQRERQKFSQSVEKLVKMNFLGEGGTSPLQMACTSDTTELFIYKGCTFPAPDVVKALLSAGTDVNAKDEEGKTALQVAREESEGSDSEVTKILLPAGAR
ncbi:hypothetical protein BaRGS_00002772 [Batillaria attramentaria]|uniref:Uncharacterized protein n=1 Tax=Batillaria attramentaria TaxID=370345 RepID=A0ABD0M2S0_9CAEN